MVKIQVTITQHDNGTMELRFASDMDLKPTPGEIQLCARLQQQVAEFLQTNMKGGLVLWRRDIGS
jgi:hypothetical protein